MEKFTFYIIGTQAMQDALAEAIQENSSIESGKNEEVYLHSEHGLAKKHPLSEGEGRYYSKLQRGKEL